MFAKILKSFRKSRWFWIINVASFKISNLDSVKINGSYNWFYSIKGGDLKKVQNLFLRYILYFDFQLILFDFTWATNSWFKLFPTYSPAPFLRHSVTCHVTVFFSGGNVAGNRITIQRKGQSHLKSQKLESQICLKMRFKRTLLDKYSKTNYVWIEFQLI